MGWTFYNASGQRLSTSATSITNLDIDGGTDIGAAIVDADLFIIDDGAGGTNRKTAASRIKTYIGSVGAVTREGAQQTEATSTSTSQTDLITAASLTVQVTEHYMYAALARKTLGASATMNLGIKQNGVETRAAENSGNARVFTTGAGNVADTGMCKGFFGPRIANYRRQGQGLYFSYGGGTSQASKGDAAIGQDGDSPLEEITEIILTGITTSASITIAVDELQIYSYASS